MTCQRKERGRDILSNLVKVAILKILSKKPLYGYAITQLVRELLGYDVDKAVIYSILRRLERHGYVSSRWDVSESGPARRVYLLTEEGKESLKRNIDCLVKLIQICRKIIDF